MNRFERHPFISLVGSLVLLFVLLVSAVEYYFSKTKALPVDDNQRMVNLRQLPEYSEYSNRAFETYYQQAGEEFDLNRTRLRVGENSYVIPSNQSKHAKTTIAFVGGSTTECVYVYEDNRFHVLIADLLNKEGYSVNAINAGKSGNHSYHSINNFLNILLGDKPDIVVFKHNINDLTALYHLGTYWNGHVNRGLVRFTSEELGFKRRLIHTFKYLLPNIYEKIFIPIKMKYFMANYTDEFMSHRSTVYVDRSEYYKTEFETAVKTFVYVARANNVIPVLMTQGRNEARSSIVNQYEPNLDLSWYLSMLAQFNQIVRNIAQTEDVALVELETFTQDKPEYFYDFVHYNNRGSSAIAPVIAEVLKHIVEQHENAVAGASETGDSRLK